MIMVRFLRQYVRQNAAQPAVARDQAIVRENQGSTRFGVDRTSKGLSRTRPAREPRTVRAARSRKKRGRLPALTAELTARLVRPADDAPLTNRSRDSD